jgi:hypothetical protein
LFTTCAGLKANKDKSEAIGIGASSNYRHKSVGLKWPIKSIKYLGVLINNDVGKIYVENFNERLEKIARLSNQWCLRKLTLKGKVLVVNSLIMPQMLYACTVLGTPEWVLKKYNRMITDFLWDNKPAKIKYSCLINNIENGGLKLQDLENKSQALKLKWIKDMCDPNTLCAWKNYIAGKIKFETHEALLTERKWIEELKMDDKFYHEVFHICDVMHGYEPITGQEVCSEQICNNSKILIGGKYIDTKAWNFPNIRFIQDLINEKGKMADVNYINKKYNVNIPTMLYNGLMSAIPQNWKNIIKIDPNVKQYVIFKDYYVKIKDKRKKVEEISTKELYWHLIEKCAQRPTSETKWQKKKG